jgi:hypothetical protein
MDCVHQILTPNSLNCKVNCDEHILHKIIMQVSVHISKQFCGSWSTMTTICSSLHQIDFQVHLTAGSFILQLYTSSFKQTRAANQRNNPQKTLGNLIRRYVYFLGVQPSMWCTTRGSFFHLLVWWACVKDIYIKNPKVCRAVHNTESTELQNWPHKSPSRIVTIFNPEIMDKQYDHTRWWTVSIVVHCSPLSNIDKTGGISKQTLLTEIKFHFNWNFFCVLLSRPFVMSKHFTV